MKTRIAIAALAAALAGTGAARADVQIAKGENFQINAGVLTQALGLGQRVDDPYKADNRMYLFMKEARVRGSGNYEDITFNLEMSLGGETGLSATTGVTLSLLDMSVNVPLHFLGNDAYIKVGQFKVPYGRERLTYSGYSQFLSRSIDDLGFRVGRDVGAAVTLKPGPFTLIGGVFTGGGRDVPPDHYLPESLGMPQLVARVGVGNEDNQYELRNDFHPTHTTWGVFVNGLYTKDSNMGHSTVLNVKLVDKSLLLNGNWNPYIGKAPFSQGTWWQMGGDAAVRAPVAANTSVSAEAELNWAGYSNDYGVLHVGGVRTQAGVTYRNVELAVRYAVLVPDQNFSAGGVNVTGSKPMQEITPSATWYIKGQNLKLVADLPVLVNTPVFTEKNIGSYVGVELPDETSVLAKGIGTVDRQTVVEGRLMLQAAF